MPLTKQDHTDIRNIVLDALDTVVEPRFNGLENQMDKLDGRMDNLDSKVDGLEGKITALDMTQRETNRRLLTVETKLEDIDGKLVASQ